MTKHYYAARHTHDRMFAYPDGWTVYVFDNRQDRDNWVDACNSDDCRNGCNQRAEIVTRDIARRIAGNNVVESLDCAGNCKMLIHNDGYYAVRYWG